MNILAKLAAAVLAAALFLPGQAAAQTMTQADVDSIVGQAMNSHEGNEYVSLNQGQAVGDGDTILVSSDSSVVLNVTDGANTWKVTLGPGTHRITPALLASNAPTGAATGASTVTSVAIILGTAAALAAGLKSMDEVPVEGTPVSQ